MTIAQKAPVPAWLMTPGTMTNMLRLNNVDSNVEMMIKAVIIVLAVAVQRAGSASA